MGIFKKKQSFASDIAQHAKNAMDLRTLTDATTELLKNPEKFGLHEKATDNGQPSVTLRGSHGEKLKFFTDKETKDGLEKTGITYDKITSLLQSLERDDPFKSKK